MTIDRKTKITLGLALALLAAVWWAATTTADLRQVRVAVEPIGEMRRDIVEIKTVLKSLDTNGVAYDRIHSSRP
jgi:hypothetical protein